MANMAVTSRQRLSLCSGYLPDSQECIWEDRTRRRTKARMKRNIDSSFSSVRERSEVS